MPARWYTVVLLVNIVGLVRSAEAAAGIVSAGFADVVTAVLDDVLAAVFDAEDVCDAVVEADVCAVALTLCGSVTVCFSLSLLCEQETSIIAAQMVSRRHFGLFIALLDEGLHTALAAEIEELFICSHSVKAAVGGYLDDSVSDGLCDLVVVSRKYNYALEVGKTVVYGGDRFKVEVVGRSVKDKHV